LADVPGKPQAGWTCPSAGNQYREDSVFDLVKEKANKQNHCGSWDELPSMQTGQSREKNEATYLIVIAPGPDSGKEGV